MYQNWPITDTDSRIGRQGQYNCSPYIQKVKLRHEKYKRTHTEPSRDKNYNVWDEKFIAWD